MDDDTCLSLDCVDVWRVPFDIFDDEERFNAVFFSMSPDEVERMQRFKVESKQFEYAVTRSTLRIVLGKLMRRPDAALRFTYSPMGKPSLDPSLNTDWQGHRVEFNVSHTAEMAVIALTCGRPVGIDVESERRDADHLALARRYFAPAEAAELEAIDENARPAAFFRCWTRKEAFVKAHGGGVAGGLDHFEVTLATDQPAAIRATHQDPDEAARWWMADVPVDEPYVASVVAARQPGEALTLRTWQLPRWFYCQG